jgi:peptidyl-prolyl cis-trans isomerase A (cyclophilin A)
MIRRSIPLMCALLVLGACSKEAEPPAAAPTAVAEAPAQAAPESTGANASLQASGKHEEPAATDQSVSAVPVSGGAIAPQGGAPVVELYTSKGVIAIQLDADKAPVSVKNFLAYVNSGFYDGTIFHRVIPGFMVQGGGMTPDMNEKPTNAPIQNEAKNGLKNVRGSLAMARTDDPNSATAQFFINVVDNGFLDPGANNPYGYAVFGKVVAGMDVVDAIAAVPTSTKGFNENVPNEPVLIQKAKVK